MNAAEFHWPVRVYYEDTDAQGVVYYANYFRYTERARTEWLRALGVDQATMLSAERRMFVVAGVNADFITPARFNDTVVVTAALATLSRASFDIDQRIHRDTIDGELLFRSRVRAAFLDADTLKPRRVPADIFKEQVG